MDILVEEKVESEYGTYITASTGKKSAFITVSKDGSLQVCCKNASHRAWNGFGRYFENVEDALNGYKSGAMKALIQMAVDLSNDTNTPVLN